jgi:hypothetical protein
VAGGIGRLVETGLQRRTQWIRSTVSLLTLHNDANVKAGDEPCSYIEDHLMTRD